MKWPRIFRKRAAAPQSDAVPDQAPHIEALQPAAPTAGTMLPGGIARFLPIGKVIDGLVSILRDPNGKISSKRAGAGALVTAGIYFLDRGKLPEGITCLVAAILLFWLTKWESA